MLRKHGVPAEKIICITDDPSGIEGVRTFPLWQDHYNLQNISGSQLPSCYRRLKLFDSEVLDSLGIPKGHAVVSFDLDAVVVQDFMWLFQQHSLQKYDFVGWRVPGHRHRIVYNGSMWMFAAGAMDWAWKSFDPIKSPAAALANGYMGSDQGYLSHQLISAQRSGGWTPGEHGVLAYVRDVVKLRILPRHTRLVFFPGKNKPWMENTQRQQPWITRYWPKPSDIVPKVPKEEEVAA